MKTEVEYLKRIIDYLSRLDLIGTYGGKYLQSGYGIYELDEDLDLIIHDIKQRVKVLET